MKTLRLLLVLAVLVLAVSMLGAQDLPDEIVYEMPGILPEGIAYDAQGERFLVGSLAQGTVFAVTDDGEITPFIEDDDLVGSVGIEIDEANGRLLVTNSDSAAFTDFQAAGLASLAAYDLESGERVYLVDFADVYETPRSFANDVTADDEGNAYVTNSFAPVIYTVDAEGNAEVLVESENFVHPFIGLNGIEYHPDGFIIAAMTGMGQLYKVTLDEEVEVTEIELESVTPVDGMVLAPDGTLNVVSGGSLVQLASEDNWASASVVAMSEGHEPATTVALRDDAFYLTYAYLQDPTRETYEIVRAEFEAMDIDADADADAEEDEVPPPVETEEASG